MAQVDTWAPTQCFGGQKSAEEVLDSDCCTSVSFNAQGTHLAVGDKAGRIWIYESLPEPLEWADCVQDASPELSEKALQKRGLTNWRPVAYKFYGQFQSHEPEFDYLKSLEIEEKINQIRWCPQQNGALCLLATNDKTIKLWRIYERRIRKVTDMNFPVLSTDLSKASSLPPIDDVKIPKLSELGLVTAASPRKVYANAHTYHINSIDLNSDGETYISADDLRVNLWHIEALQSFQIIDIKPKNMEDLTEVITAARFHPQHCNLLAYSTSRGCIKLADLRDSALVHNYSKVFEQPTDLSDRGFFTEIVNSISDISWINDGRYFASRDYVSIKIWDVNMEARPVQTIPIHDYLNDHLCDLYENDCIFDKFECAGGGRNGMSLATGTYDDGFALCNWDTTDSGGPKCQFYRAEKPAPSKVRGEESAPTKKSKKKKNVKIPDSKMDPTRIQVTEIDFAKKSLHVTWHPKRDVIALASLHNLYIYQRRTDKKSML